MADFQSQQLMKGDRLYLLFAAANRDPEAFENASEIDITRSPNRHLAFGLGVRRCLGSIFARVMFQVMISEVLRRIPDARVAGEIERFPDAGDVFAVEKLLVRFTSGARLGV